MLNQGERPVPQLSDESKLYFNTDQEDGHWPCLYSEFPENSHELHWPGAYKGNPTRFQISHFQPTGGKHTSCLCVFKHGYSRTNQTHSGKQRTWLAPWTAVSISGGIRLWQVALTGSLPPLQKELNPVECFLVSDKAVSVFVHYSVNMMNYNVFLFLLTFSLPLPATVCLYLCLCLSFSPPAPQPERTSSIEG